MNTVFKKIKLIIIVLIACLFSFTSYSQLETATWKAQFAAGVNSPSQSAFVSTFKAKPINFSHYKFRCSVYV